MLMVTSGMHLWVLETLLPTPSRMALFSAVDKPVRVCLQLIRLLLVYRLLSQVVRVGAAVPATLLEEFQDATLTLGSLKW